MQVFGGEVGVLGEDLLGAHPIGEHRHHRRDREAQPSDAGQAAHDRGVGGDAFADHMFMLTAE